MGADIVLDTNFAADIVIMEEGHELLHRIRQKGVMPMFTSCCPAWISFVEKNYPEMRDHLSTTKSPQQCFGAMAKTYLADNMEIDPGKMRVVSIMPCTAKKGEAKRREHTVNGVREVDAVLTTREFARLLRREGIDPGKLEPSDFDNPWMGNYSGAAVIFGTTGGVMEAAVRTVHKVVTGEELPDITFEAVRGMDHIREAQVDLGPEAGKVKVAVVHTLKAAAKVLDALKDGTADYAFVEVMSCPGGCMGGGGQPRSKQAYQAAASHRRQGLYGIDMESKIRQSHNNPQIRKLYADYLEKPLGHKSHRLLHTAYQDRKRLVKHTMKEIWQEIEERV